MASNLLDLTFAPEGFNEDPRVSSSYHASQHKAAVKQVVTNKDRSASTVLVNLPPIFTDSSIRDAFDCGGEAIVVKSATFVVSFGERTGNEHIPEFERLKFLDWLYQIDEKISSRHAVNVVIEHVDDLLNDGDFQECAAVLNSADVQRLSNSALLSFLGITSAAKDNPIIAASRRQFYNRAINVVASRRGHDGAERLLAKYR